MTPATIVLAVWLMAGGFPVWDKKSLCEYVAHKMTEGWSAAQLRDLARSNHVPERVIKWAEKNC